MINQDLYFMGIALDEAKKAYCVQEVPIGAVVVLKNRVIAKAHNDVEKKGDGTAHAELTAIQKACNVVGNKYLHKCTLFSTLEPCPLCAWAIFLTQLGRLVFGADDLKRGYRLWSPSLIHPKTTVNNGIRSEECSILLKFFFKELRNEKIV